MADDGLNSIATEITRINTAKTDIKTAIENLGETVPEDTKLDGMAAYINSAGGKYLPLAGGTMTGALTLSGAPETDLQAANKGYVDDAVPKLGITSGAAVGQLAKVKAVDENGVPTEWETVDDEPGTVVYTLTGSDANGYTIDGLDTPYTTIQAQIEAGKNVVLKRMSGIYSLAANASGMFIFVYQYNTLTDSITIKSDNTITKSPITLQTLSAMTDDISANATSTGKYPSTKGVADYVAAKVKTYTAGAGISISDDNVISAPKTSETWTFTLADGSTVTKSVVISS